MAYIKTLKDNELIGGTDNTDVYPVSSTQAIFSQNPDGTVPGGIKHQRLEERLQDHEEDAEELHRKAEKLIVYLTNSQNNKTLEITDTQNTAVLTGHANVETYGDEPASSVATTDMTTKQLSVTYSSATENITGAASDNNWVGNYSIPNVVGTYTFKFNVTYNGITKNATSNTYVNLRKYFGFADEQPADVTTLNASHFSNSVGCTITLPANGTGFKKVYLAVPNGMTINSITQPDALNAPLAFSQVGTVTRTIGNNSFTYKLYASDDNIDSSASKRLTIA